MESNLRNVPLTQALNEYYIKDFSSYSLKFEDLNQYVNLTKIGGGSYGVVYKAEEKENKSNLVAIKKIKMHDEKKGYPITILREIRVLKKIEHPNVVRLLHLCQNTTDSSLPIIYLVMEYCQYDLSDIIKHLQFNLANIKYILTEILEGINYIHFNNIMHRDLKPANILVTKIGEIKLADFGLARSSCSENNNTLTTPVISRWYCPPEVLLGSRNYSISVDMWSLGCIMAELYTRKPILKGSSDQNQLDLISWLCGSITPKIWPEVENCPLYHSVMLPENRKNRVSMQYPEIAKDILAIDLLKSLININPSKRIDAAHALGHCYFRRAPVAENLEQKMHSLLESYHTTL